MGATQMINTGFQTFRDRELKWIGHFVDMLPVGLFRTTLEGRFTFCNREFAEIFGFASAVDLKDYSIASLHWNTKDRGEFFKEITEKGYVRELSLPFKKRDGLPIWCSITARIVYDEDDVPVFVDGTILDITSEIGEDGRAAHTNNALHSLNDYFCILDLSGRFLSINRAGAEMLGFEKKALMGSPLTDLIVPRFKKAFSEFLVDIKKHRYKGGVLTITNRNGKERNLEFNAFLVTRKGRSHHISCVARDITEKIKNDQEQMEQKKFQGVLEMAGGVSHRLNQPLTIINNLINEVLSGFSPEDHNYRNLAKIHEQIQKLNELAKKIGGIKKYESMDYVAGIKIVDIDKAS